MGANVQSIYIKEDKDMRKHFKSIAATVMMGVMLVTSCMPTMAAEQVSEVDDATTLDQTTEITENVESDAVARSLNGEFHYSGRLSKDKVLGIVDVTSNSRSVRWTVGRTGSDGLVNLRLTNVVTGETRSFSTIANNTLGTMTWTSPLPAGSWEVKVIYVESFWLYDVDLYFYTN